MEKIVDAFGNAIERAKLLFFRDHEGIFRRNNSFFKTRVLRDGQIYDALVIPTPSKEFYGDVGIILRDNVYGPTHVIDDVEVRMMVKVQGRQGLIDPYDFEYGE